MKCQISTKLPKISSAHRKLILKVLLESDRPTASTFMPINTVMTGAFIRIYFFDFGSS